MYLNIYISIIYKVHKWIIINNINHFNRSKFIKYKNVNIMNIKFFRKKKQDSAEGSRLPGVPT